MLRAYKYKFIIYLFLTTNIPYICGMAAKHNFTKEQKDEIINYYLSGYSTSETAKFFSITSATVSNILSKNNIKARTISEGNILKWKNNAFRENQITKRKGRPSGALGKTWKINHRVFRPNLIGEKNHFWKGGKTKLSLSIRALPEYSIWRLLIFKRDNYTCVICKRKRKTGDGVIIECDHIYPLYKIIDDNKLRSISEAVGCKELWDIDNGRTLCMECHKKTLTYGVNQYTKFK